MRGKRVRIPQWIHSDTCALHLEVHAVIPVADPGDSYLEPDTLRYLDRLQDLADAGDFEELAGHGKVYVRRAATLAR